MKIQVRIFLSILLVLLCLVSSAAAQTMANYSWQPPVIADSSQPNTMLLLSNDWTGFTEGYKDTVYNDNKEYWGYFDPKKYYKYKNPNGPFEPVGFNSFGTHYVPASAGNDKWSGNFLNWVTMSNADFLRKALTGGKRGTPDAVGSTRLVRGLIQSGRAWKKSAPSVNLNRLVPAVYANTSYEFYNTAETFAVRNGGSTVGGPFNVEALVCVVGLLEDNCRFYPQVGEAKPEGLIHQYADKMRFALMTYTHGAKESEGGVLRTPMKTVDDEWSSTNGQQNNGISGMIRYIENYTEKGWDATAEMYYDALRYLKGNTGASAAYCDGTNMQADDGYPVFGCKSNKPWPEDPIIDWCQANNIIILNDEYPSQEHNSLPGSAFNPGYSVTTNISGGNDHPYNIDVSAETKAVGDWEKAHNTTSTIWRVGEILGGIDDGKCDGVKAVNDLSLARGICPTEPNGTGTFYLAGLAHHAFTHDLRGDYDNVQNVATWTLAFRATSNATYNPPDPPMNQLWLAAKYGNFDDLNGNGKPDAGEWEDPDRVDKNGKPLPYAYYSAEDGKQLVDAFSKIFDSILETTASSTSVSVLANSGQGEGNLVQAYYRPRISLGEATVDWVGFVQSLWIDEYGYIREDTVKDNVLNHTQDNVIRYVEGDGTTKAWVYPVDATTPFPDFVNDSHNEVALEEVKVLWDAGRVLSKTDPSDRKIFTFIDKNKDGLVAERQVANPPSNVFDDSGEVIQFYDRNYRALMPYLNVADDVLDGYLGRSQKIRALNLVRWTQGYDPEVDSNRFVDINNVAARTRSLDGTDVYKLGDVINSTPVTIAAPPDSYHIIYSDESYQTYYDKYKNRETMVYVGANDGMMHAFTAWKFDKNQSAFVDPDPIANEPIGSELWAYIPQTLLPHLKWIPRDDYSHVYYVDLQPRIFDARIFTSDADTTANSKHPNGWGTILVGGYSIGGGKIDVNDKFDDGTGTVVQETRTFKPSYFAIDITNPRKPELLWDRTYENLGMSYSFPTIMRVDNPTQPIAPKEDNDGKWYLVFGSGPDDGSRSTATPQYDGDSEDPGYFYVVDVKTGTPFKSNDGTDDHDYLFATPETNAFMGPPVSFDKNLNYNVDAVYVPVTYDNGSAANHDWMGSIWKLTIPWKGPLSTPVEKYSYGTAPSRYTSEPFDTAGSGAKPWTFNKLFASPRPITAAPALSIDQFNNTWVYFGTGRMFEGDDSSESDFGSDAVESMYGIKDPFFSSAYASSTPVYYLNYSNNKTLTAADLFDADPYVVLNTGVVYTLVGTTYTYFGYFDEMLDDARAFDGWKRSLRQYDETVDGNTVTRSMRSLNKPSVLGGLSLFATFMPTGNTCSFGGESDLNILYYETGTAYKRSVARGAAGLKTIADLDGDGTDEKQIRDAISLGAGTTSSVGIHIGRQNQRASASGDDPEGDMVTGFVQQGTGMVVEIDIETALKIRSGLRSWRER